MNRITHIKNWLLVLPNKYKIIVSAIVIVSVIVIQLNNRSSNTDLFDVHTVNKGEISETIVNSGNANITSNAAVYSPTTGIVDSVFVKNGDVVIEGQELIKIKSTASEIETSIALASYKAAQSALDVSKQAKISNQSLLEAGRKIVIDAAISLEQMNNRRTTGANNPLTNKQYTPDEIESITSAYTSAIKSFESLERKYLDSDRAIAAAQSTVTSKWLSYESTLNGVVKAPIGGTVSNVSVEPGDSIAASSSEVSSANTIPLLRLSTMDTLSIKVRLSEIDIAKVHPSQSATVVFDAIPEKIFSAVVTRVDTVGTNNNAVVTYDAYVALTDRDNRIRPGMTATITIKTDVKKDVLVVPNIGLLKENNETKVQVQTGKSIKKKTVTIGIKNTSHSEILSGLSEGETIIIPKAK